MGKPAAMNGPPRRILLSTDFSPRCDRALDRAARLAAEWSAELIALRVLEPLPPSERQPAQPEEGSALPAEPMPEERLPEGSIPEKPLVPDLRGDLLRDLQEDLKGTGVEANLRLAWGEVADAVERTTAELGADLVITGMARSETLGRFLLGSAVERLASRLPQPLLVVRKRVRSAYGRIVIATDFSASSAAALRAALRFFPGRELVLYHAYRRPPSGGGEKIAAESVSSETGPAQYERFLAELDLPEGARERLCLRVERGTLSRVLPRYVRDQDIDLVVMGARGRGGLVGALLGSTGVRLLHRLPCDSLIVKEDAVC